MEARKDELDMKRNNIHYFDEQVTMKDAYLISPVTEGALSRLNYRSSHVGTSNVNNLKQGDYAGRHFTGVYEALESRGLVMPLELPEKVPKPFVRLGSIYMKYPMLTLKIEKALLAAKNSTDGSDVWLDLPELNTIASTISLKDILPHSSLYRVTFNGTSNGGKGSEVKKILTSPKPVTLPAFANDHSEMFLASMIERQADSWDLHLTAFLMSHSVMIYDLHSMTAQDIYRDRDTMIEWSKASLAFLKAAYQKNGARTTSPRHFCKITTKSGDKEYTVEGTVLYVHTIISSYHHP